MTVELHCLDIRALDVAWKGIEQKGGPYKFLAKSIGTPEKGDNCCTVVLTLIEAAIPRGRCSDVQPGLEPSGNCKQDEEGKLCMHKWATEVHGLQVKPTTPRDVEMLLYKLKDEENAHLSSWLGAKANNVDGTCVQGIAFATDDEV